MNPQGVPFVGVLPALGITERVALNVRYFPTSLLIGEDARPIYYIIASCQILAGSRVNILLPANVSITTLNGFVPVPSLVLQTASQPGVLVPLSVSAIAPGSAGNPSQRWMVSVTLPSSGSVQTRFALSFLGGLFTNTYNFDSTVNATADLTLSVSLYDPRNVLLATTTDSMYPPSYLALLPPAITPTLQVSDYAPAASPSFTFQFTPKTTCMKYTSFLYFISLILTLRDR